MKDDYDFSNAPRGAVAPTKGKTRITIMLDDVVIDVARQRAESLGIGYQTVINNILRDVLVSQKQSLPATKKKAPLATLIDEGISRSEVEALEHQLIAVAGELNRVLAGKAKPSKQRVKAHH